MWEGGDAGKGAAAMWRRRTKERGAVLEAGTSKAVGEEMRRHWSSTWNALKIWTLYQKTYSNI